MGQTEEEDEDTLLYPAEEIVPYIPRFMSDKEPVSGAARGTAYHRALECLDFRGLYHSEKVKEGLEQLVEEGRMTREQADVDVYKRQGFTPIQNKLMQKLMQYAKKVMAVSYTHLEVE